MKVSDYIIDFLGKQGITHVFEMSGGMIAHFLDSLARQKAIKVVSMHHEQGAAFAVDGFGRVTGLPGVAFATSGPGATNLLTGIGSCHFDSVPALFITGQVNRHELKGDRAIRQLGFQETDIVTMAAPITKAAWQARSVEEIPELLERAFRLAIEGRPGPVLLDIPMDIQRGDLPEPPTKLDLAPKRQHVSPEAMDALFTAVERSERPLMLVGGGVRSGWVRDEIIQLAERLNIPIVYSLMAVDVVPYEHPLHVGMIGSYGNRWSNLAMGQADLLLVLGSRLDIRQTGADTASWRAGREIFHVDVAPGELNNRVTGCHAILATLRDFVDAALPRTAGRSFPKHTDWTRTLEELHLQWPDTDELQGVKGINPNILMHQLSGPGSAADVFVVDVGQHQMWAAQSLEIQPHQRFLTSGGMGSMGFSLPAAIGAAASGKSKCSVVIAGDGCFQANIQELQTVFRCQLPIKMVVINNRCHGMVRQFQESYFEGRYQSTMWGYSAPDFAAVAKAYGIEARHVSEAADVEGAVEWLYADPQKPQLLEVAVDSFANAYPKIAFGKPMTEMEPLSQPVEMEST